MRNSIKRKVIDIKVDFDADKKDVSRLMKERRRAERVLQNVEEAIRKMSKKWYKSKTLWFNAISIAIVAIDKAANLNVVPIDVAAMLIAVGNAVLRFVSSGKIKS